MKQEIYWEKSSDPELRGEIWQVAEELGYSDRFISRPGYRIIDDHTPFQKQGIPTLDIIDFEFGESNRYWHTKADTMDKISSKSLKTVGNVTLELLWNVK